MEQIAHRHDAMGQLSSPSATAAGEASFAGPLLRLWLSSLPPFAVFRPQRAAEAPRRARARWLQMK